MATYTWDAIYDRLKVDQGGLPNKSTQDMLDTFWTLAGYPDGTLGADQKIAFYESQGAVGDSLGDLEYDYWYRVGPNILAAKGAVFAIDAAQSINGEQWALNRGSGGQVLRARYGSVGRAEIRNGVGVLFPNASGNYVAIPWSSPTDMDIVVRLLNDPCYTTTSYPMGQYGSNMSWAVVRDSANLLAVVTKDSGGSGAIPAIISRGARPDIAVNTWYWARIRRVSSTGVWTIEVQPDGPMPSSWGTVHSSSAGPTGALTGATENRLGEGSSPDLGAISYYQHATSIGGVPAYVVDFTAQADLVSSFVASTGQTVTVTAANAVDTNDPLFLPWNGENYVYFPGGTGSNSASIPDSSVWCTSDSDVRVRAAADDWTSGTAYRAFVSQGWGDASGYGIWFGLDQGSSGKLGFFFGSSGAGLVAGGVSTVDPGLVDGQVYDLRATRVGSTGATRFWMKDTSTPLSSNTGWTEIGTSQAFYAGFGIQNWSTGALHMGSAPGNEHANKLYRVMLHDAIDGTAVVDVDFTQNSNHSSFVCTTGQTVTFNRSATGRKTAVVTRPIWLFGTDDYLEVADNDLLDFDADDDAHMIAIVRYWGSPAGNQRVLSKLSGTEGWVIAKAGASQNLDASWLQNSIWRGPGSIATTAGNIQVWGVYRDTSGTKRYGHINNTPLGPATVPAETLTNSQPVRIGCESSGGSFLDGEVLAVGIFRRALSVTEIAQIVTYYGAS